MTFPTKSKGFRSINVDGHKFYWKFSPSPENSTLKIYSETSKNTALTVELPDWIDPWHSINGFSIDQEKKMNLTTTRVNEPAIITSKFAQESISFALKKGWNTNLEKMTIQYKNNHFHLSV